MEHAESESLTKNRKPLVLGLVVLSLVVLVIAGFILNQRNQEPPIIPDPDWGFHKETDARIRTMVRNGEIFWRRTLPEQMGKNYVDVDTHVIVGGHLQLCESSKNVVGNLFCPSNNTAAFDQNYFEDIRLKKHASGDLAEAYIVAHTIAHNIQSILDKERSLQLMRINLSGKDPAHVVLRSELQADFYAGVWAKKEMKGLDPKKVEKAMSIVAEVTKTHQDKTGKTIILDPITHGTLAQRVKWFMRGYKSGKIKDGDTFHAKDL